MTVFIWLFVASMWGTASLALTLPTIGPAASAGLRFLLSGPADASRELESNVSDLSSPIPSSSSSGSSESRSPCSKSPSHQAGEEEDEPRDHQRQADEDQGDDDVHASLRPDSRSAVRLTTATELTGMMIAATTGVTSPARHRATAAVL